MGEPESLDTDEPLPKRVERHDYDRLIMLSDGVFSIAMTLLALEIRVPESWDGTFSGLFRSMWRQLFAFFVSFVVVGFYWNAHKRVFARLTRVDGPATALCVLLLGLIVLLPPVCRMIAERGPHGQALALYLFYIGAIGLAQTLLWGYASLIGNMAHPDVSIPKRRLMLATMGLPSVALCSLSLFSKQLGSSALSLVLVAVLFAVVVVRRVVAPRLERVSP